MSAAPPNPYLRTRVMTASPVQLQLMLFDGAIRFLEQGRSGLESRDFEAAYNGISRGQSIIMELLNGLRPERAPDLCEKLSAMYTFMYTQLVKASTERSPKLVEEVLDLLRYERETWQMLMTKLAEGGAEQAPAAAPSAGEPAAASPGAEQREDGQLSVRG